jgi:Flp pilus assembly protein TadD
MGLALIAKTEGNYEEALKNLTELIEKEPKNHRLYIDAAECCESLGRKDDALEILSRFQKLGIHSDRVTEYERKLQES